MKILDILVILLVICAIKYFFDSKEHFMDKISKVKSYPEISDDRLFNDVVQYENDNDDGRLGLDKCLEKCNGTCVEFGPTGAATCFPKSSLDNLSYYDTMRKTSTEHDSEEIDRVEKVKFANMR